MNALIAKATVAKTSQIKEMLNALSADLSNEATTVTDALLTILEGRVTEAEFVSFCEELEAA